MFIYTVENLLNGKRYVGQTTNISKREESHLHGYSKCPAIKSAVNKYGRENFDFVIIERCFSQDQLNKREIYWIEELDSLAPNGYNLKKGGECGGKLSDETKRKISINRKGKNCGTENPMYGVKLTDAHKEKIGKSNRGKTSGEKNPWFGKFGVDHPRYGVSHTEEYKKKMRERMRGANNPNYGNKGADSFHYGKPHSEESKNKMRAALKKAWAEGRFKNRKPRGGTD